MNERLMKLMEKVKKMIGEIHPFIVYHSDYSVSLQLGELELRGDLVLKQLNSNSFHK